MIGEERSWTSRQKNFWLRQPSLFSSNEPPQPFPNSIGVWAWVLDVQNPNFTRSCFPPKLAVSLETTLAMREALIILVLQGLW